MKQYIYALIALLFMLIVGLPASAQPWRTGIEVLQSLRQGSVDLVLSNTIKETIEPTVFASQNAAMRYILQANLKSIANAQADLAKPVNLSVSGAQVSSTVGAFPTTSYVNVPVQRKLALTEAQQTLQRTLYEWGELQDRARQLGYIQDTYAVAMPDGSARLKINGRTSLISYQQQVTSPLPFILPDEVYTHAQAIKNLVDSYAGTEMVLLARYPEYAAAWFYLKENFLNSWEEFQATRFAYLKLYTPANGNWLGRREWISAHHEFGTRVTHNYNYASAELALDCAKLLKYMSIHENVFPQAIPSYERMLPSRGMNVEIGGVFRNILPQNPIFAH